MLELPRRSYCYAQTQGLGGPRSHLLARLARRPALAVGLTDIAVRDACTLGHVDAAWTPGLVEATAAMPDLPPVGSLLVVDSPGLDTIGALAVIEERCAGRLGAPRDTPRLVRLLSMVSGEGWTLSRERGNGEAESAVERRLVEATQQLRLPLRYRVDAVRSWLHCGDFVGASACRRPGRPKVRVDMARNTSHGTKQNSTRLVPATAGSSVTEHQAAVGVPASRSSTPPAGSNRTPPASSSNAASAAEQPPAGSVPTPDDGGAATATRSRTAPLPSVPTPDGGAPEAGRAVAKRLWKPRPPTRVPDLRELFRRRGHDRAPSMASNAKGATGVARYTVVHATSDLRSLTAEDANLYAAWERVRDNARARGTWTREHVEFEADLGEYLRSLSTALRAGRWQPGRARPVRIPKRAGGHRRLHIPPVADRVAERALAQTLSELVDGTLSPWSFAFRPGWGVDDAVRVLAQLRDDGMTHVARFDIANCFDTFDRTRLREVVREFVDDPWTVATLDRVIDRELPGLPQRERLDGIAQGSPLSPLLANLALDELDRGLVAAGLPAVRYADDLALPAGSEPEAQQALETAVALLGDMGLAIKPEKSQVVAFDDVVEFLGHRFGPDFPTATPELEREPPRRRTLYVTADARHVALRSGHVRVFGKDRDTLLSVPVSGVGRIVTLGPAGISSGLRSHALMHGVDVSFLSRNGGWLGRYDGGTHIDAALRRRQYRMLDDDQRRLEIARTILVGKLGNQRALLQRYARRGSGETVTAAVATLEELSRRLWPVTAVASLLGYEGTAANAYFTALADLFTPAARFTGRNRRPPKDPGNAALSFAYVLLTAEAHAACATAGLEPHVGILHAVSKRRPALALDLMEEFRPLVVDATVLSLFRRRRLRDEHFRGPNADGAVLLTDDGRRIVVEAYETRMLTRFHHRPSRTRMDYRRGLHAQAGQLADVVRGVRDRFEPVGWR